MHSRTNLLNLGMHVTSTAPKCRSSSSLSPTDRLAGKQRTRRRLSPSEQGVSAMIVTNCRPQFYNFVNFCVQLIFKVCRLLKAIFRSNERHLHAHVSTLWRHHTCQTFSRWSIERASWHGHSIFAQCQYRWCCKSPILLWLFGQMKKGNTHNNYSNALWQSLQNASFRKKSTAGEESIVSNWPTLSIAENE